MSRIERLREYRAMKGPAGESSSKENLRYWSERATANSDSYRHRAKSGEISLPDLGGDHATTDRGGAMSGVGRIEAAHREVRRDRNYVGSSYMRGVRRTTS
jgi:hypothetical protein